jgi:hypothetical protein
VLYLDNRRDYEQFGWGVLVNCSATVCFWISFGCVMFLAGPALSGRFCTSRTGNVVLVLHCAVLLMDSCLIKPAPLLALQPGCLHRAETSSTRLRQLGMQSKTGQCSGVTRLFTRPTNSTTGDSSDGIREEPVLRRASRRQRQAVNPKPQAR